MALDDNDLLDFDASNMPMHEAGEARRLLHEYGDAFRYQLVAARWIEGYAIRRLVNSDTPALVAIEGHERFEGGAQDALRDIAAHLRQGDFMPGGPLYDDEMSGRNDPHPPDPLRHGREDPTGRGP